VQNVKFIDGAMFILILLPDKFNTYTRLPAADAYTDQKRFKKILIFNRLCLKTKKHPRFRML